MVFCGSTTGNLWRQARVLISAVFASVVAFAWVDAFRATREWATYDMEKGVYKAGISALLAFIFAFFGVILALLLIMVLLRNDNEEVTSLSETLSINVQHATGFVSESKQFSFEHNGHLELAVEGTFSSTIVTDLVGQIIANGKVMWTFPFQEDAYPEGGSFKITRSVPPLSSENTIIELKLEGTAAESVSVQIDAVANVTDGTLCS